MKTSMSDSELTPGQIDSLKERLLASRKQIVEQGRGHLADALGMDNSVSDEMDQASRDQELDTLLHIADGERDRVLEIDAALQRIDDGTYGICEGSGEPIGFRRLETQPWTRYSVGYQEQLERDQKMLRGNGN